MLPIRRFAFSSATALAVLAGVTSAHAEVVTYYFTATIDSADEAELSTIGFPSSGDLSGALSYDTDAGWGSIVGSWSSDYVDPNLSLDIDQMPAGSDPSTIMVMNEWTDNLQVVSNSQVSDSNVTASLKLTDQDASWGSMPSSLSFGGSSSGILKLFVGGDFSDVDLRATLTSLVQGVASRAPELDPKAGGAALVLLLGGAFLLMGDRRRRFIGAFG